MAVFVLGASGCGGGDEKQVEEALMSYASALRDRDFDRACDALSERTREQIESGGGGCPANVEKAASRTGRELLDPEIETVEIDGDTARVELKGAETPAVLVKEEGDWKVGG